MRAYFSQFLLSAFVLYMSQSCFVVNAQDEVFSFEQMKKQREEAIKAFESHPANTPAYSSTLRPADAFQQNEKPHQYSFEANPLQKKSKEHKEQEAKAESELLQAITPAIAPAIAKEEPMIESPDYIHKLSRALPCFKQFIGNLYQARYKRDSEITVCATNGNEACTHKEASQFEKTSITLTDKFYQCLDLREAGHTANLSR